jgi:hypothetical protein
MKDSATFFVQWCFAWNFHFLCPIARNFPPKSPSWQEKAQCDADYSRLPA